MKKHLLALLVLAVILFLPPFLKNYGIYMFTTWLIYVIATMGLNLTVGFAGQKSLGHAAFFGIGAYTVAIAMKAGISWWVGLPAAMALCFVVGLVLGFPALRVQTIYLAFATLGFNTAVWLVMRNEEWLTGGTFGLNGIPRPEIFGYSLEDSLPYYYFVLAVTAIAIGLLWCLLRSPWGKAFQALRDNPIRAESLGIDTRSYTLLSFAIGAVFAGVAGVLFASLVDFIGPAPFAVGAAIMMRSLSNLSRSMLGFSIHDSCPTIKTLSPLRSTLLMTLVKINSSSDATKILLMLSFLSLNSIGLRNLSNLVGSTSVT
jgi:branched-chain amino acid transport system permease protein